MEFVSPRTDTQPLRVIEARGPIDVRVDMAEFLARSRVALIRQRGSLDGGSRVNRVNAGLIEGNGVRRSKDPDVRDDRRVVIGPTIAVWGHVHYEVYVELGLAVENGLGVLGDSLAANAARAPLARSRGAKLADGHALTAAGA